jgi:predicted MPP superfamily phosphohydrolase
MRLLLTADLHFRLHWFHWLIEQASDFDLVCIAGDLLDMFNPGTRLDQAREVRTLIRKLADLVPVAVCSGNHDNGGRLVLHDRASVYGVVHRAWDASEHHDRWLNTKARKPDRDGSSLSLLPARENHLA